MSQFDFINNQRTEARQNGLSYTGPVDRFYPNAKLSYVTGSHAVRAGMQWSFGPDGNAREMNGHLNQEYAGRDAAGNLIPDRVEIYNAPTWGTAYVERDLGIYAQDTWTIDRLTVNAGVRFELFKAVNHESGGPAGRFVPARAFAEQQNVPLWNDVAPRFSAVYDLFGDARTALKLGVNKYMQPMTGSIAKRYLLGGVLTDDRDWFDCALDPAIFQTGVATCSGNPLYAGTDRDNIAQDHEIGLINNRPLFLERSDTGRRLADDHARPYNLEWSGSIQHEIAPRTSVTAAYYRRQFYNLEGQNNLLVDPSDYVRFPVVSPLGGETFTLFNLNSDLRGIRDIVDANSDTNRNVYDAIELSTQARLNNGGLVSLGWTGQKWVQNTCDQENPNGLPGLDFNDRTTVIIGGRFCDQGALGIPFRHDFKSQWAFPFPYDIWFSGTLQSYSGAMKSVEWTVPTSVFGEAGLVRTETTRVDLVAPGSAYRDRWNQVDISFRKAFQFGQSDFSMQVDLYNVNNSNVVLTETESFGPTLGTPNTILTGRLMRLAFQLKW